MIIIIIIISSNNRNALFWYIYTIIQYISIIVLSFKAIGLHLSLRIMETANNYFVIIIILRSN